MMNVEVIIPEDYLGDIMGHVTARRGRVEGMEAHGSPTSRSCDGSTC